MIWTSQNCDNWRGITLLSTPSKVFCRILLGRIDKALDSKLREAQAGFRRGRGCVDQIFALRNIIEQCLEWKTPLFINFIDFRKAFDSVHRESLWKILATYGLPAKIISLIRAFYTNFECSVVLDNNTVSDPFPVESGVRQGCILSPILFLIAIDWVMRQTTSDRPRGIQWNLFSQLEDLDFADDLSLLSSKQEHLQQKTERLNTFSKQVGLNINRKKSQVMAINTPSTKISLDGEDLEDVKIFTYLGSVINQESGPERDIQSRLGKASGAFSTLHSIWKSKQITLKTKVKLYNSNVKSVLLYGSECWRETKKDMSKIEAFHNRCLRKLCNIYWPNKISNARLYERTGCRSIVQEIRQRRLRWLGHVLRMPAERVPKKALRWTPPGKRKPGRPRTTWRRTVTKDLEEMGLTWGTAQATAQDRDSWRRLTAALCPRGDEEPK